jgi:hypothetical protein
LKKMSKEYWREENFSGGWNWPVGEAYSTRLIGLAIVQGGLSQHTYKIQWSAIRTQGQLVYWRLSMTDWEKDGKFGQNIIPQLRFESNMPWIWARYVAYMYN